MGWQYDFIVHVFYLNMYIFIVAFINLRYYGYTFYSSSIGIVVLL
jgi:hypothetical protein